MVHIQSDIPSHGSTEKLSFVRRLIVFGSWIMAVALNFSEALMGGPATVGGITGFVIMFLVWCTVAWWAGHRQDRRTIVFMVVFCLGVTVLGLLAEALISMPPFSSSNVFGPPLFLLLLVNISWAYPLIDWIEGPYRLVPVVYGVILTAICIVIAFAAHRTSQAIRQARR